MDRLIETLESRQFLSAAPVYAAVHVSATPAVHAPATPVVTLVFQGTAYNTSQDKVAANIGATLTKLKVGYKAEVLATSPGNPDSAEMRFTMQSNAAGHFTYAGKLSDGTGTLHLQLQLSADLSTLSGAFTQTSKGNGGSAGTVMLSRVPTPTPTPAPTPTPTPAATGVTYTGSAVSATRGSSTLTLVLFKSGGSTFGLVSHTDSDGTGDQLTVKFDAAGHFVYKGDGQNAGLHLQGQISADKSTISGTFTSKNGKSTDSGRFALTLG